MMVESYYKVCDGTDIFYEIIGDGEENLLFLHGNGGDSTFFEYQI